MKRIGLIVLLMISIAEIADAQSLSYQRNRDRKWMFSFGAGASIYDGDIHSAFYDSPWPALGGNIGVGLSRKLGSQMSFRLDLNYYQISGEDASKKNGTIKGRKDDRYVRNLSFKATNLEGSLLFTFNIIPVNGYRRRPVINPYLLFGVGITTNNPKGNHPVEGVVNLRHLNTEALPGQGYSGTLLTVPAGLGIRVKAGENVDILFEAGRRFLFSDYLDDVSTVYPSKKNLEAAGRIGTSKQALIFYDRAKEGTDLEGNPLPPNDPGDIRGNPKTNDSYYMVQIRLEMYLPLSTPSRKRKRAKYR